MFKGTTPTIKWHIRSTGVNFEDFEKIWMTFKDENNCAITKEASKDVHDLEIDEKKKTISYELTQEDTLGLRLGKIETQLRILFKNGQAYATPIKEFTLDRVLKGGVIE